MRCAVCHRKIDSVIPMFLFHSDEDNRDKYACETCEDQFFMAQATRDSEAINYLRVYIDEMPDGETKSKLTKKLKEVISGQPTSEYEKGRLPVMFSNVGGKIKGLAQVITWIGIVASVIGGIVLMSKVSFIVGLLTAVVGSLFSWIGSLALYGFGQLVENSDQCVYYLTSIDRKKQA